MMMRKVLLVFSLASALVISIATAFFFLGYVLVGCYPSYCGGGVCTTDCGGSPPAIIFGILGMLITIDLILWLLFGYLHRKKSA